MELTTIPLCVNGNKPNHLTLVSSTKNDVTTQVTSLTTEKTSVSKVSKVLKVLKVLKVSKPKSVYFKFPFQRINNRIPRYLKDQYNFYKSDKAAVGSLTVLTANSSMSWFVFSSNISADSASIIIGINAFLYAYLEALLSRSMQPEHAPNWAKVLRNSKAILKRSYKFKNLNNSNFRISFQLCLQTLFIFFLLYSLSYYGFIETVLNWSHLENLMSFDIMGIYS